MRSAADGLGWVVQPGPLSIDSFGEFVRQVAGATAVSRVCIVADRHRAALPTISGLVGELVERFDAEVHAAEDDSDELVASIAGAGPWDVVIGVGGGVTLDVAKLVALRSDDLRRATAPGRSSRVVLPDSARTARLAWSRRRSVPFGAVVVGMPNHARAEAPGVRHSPGCGRRPGTAGSARQPRQRAGDGRASRSGPPLDHRLRIGRNGAAGGHAHAGPRSDRSSSWRRDSGVVSVRRPTSAPSPRSVHSATPAG